MIERFRQLSVVRAFDRTDVLLIVFAALALWFAVFSACEVLNALGSFGAGTFLSLLVSRYYSKRAAEELREEADTLREESDKLQRLVTLIIRGLDEAGLIDVTKDERGMPTGGLNLKREISDAIRTEGSVSLHLEIRRREDANPEQPGSPRPEG
jgi:hypothetical protein